MGGYHKGVHDIAISDVMCNTVMKTISECLKDGREDKESEVKDNSFQREIEWG